MSVFTQYPELKQLNFRHPLHLLAVGFGSGLSPKMPGTTGTLGAVVAYLLLNPALSIAGWLIFIVLGFALGVWACQAATDVLGKEDHGCIVWDEFIGYFITMLAAPAGWPWVVLGFVLFRFFDILKPQPIRWFDAHIKGGLGIMLDDVLAGIMAWIVLQLIAALM